ncbi:MAG: pyridine nucleotide-disulfide oxidoreductase [Bacteroidia bacterium]|nr:pyridine nucleotide-disulfide oxidoreductase [Bacteroidia bacterium]
MQVPRADFDTALAQSVARMGVPVDFETTVTAIEFDDHGYSRTAIKRADGQVQTIRANFIVDASGYGRVIPRLFNLDRPSNLEPRKAVFAHVEDKHRDHFDEPNRIIVVIYQPGVWVWIIPFSNGITSLGFVANPDFFNDKGDDQKTQFRNLIDSHPYLNKRFGDQPWAWEPRKLEAWSTTTDKFYGNGFVLTGNVTEFLDPIFSSGVMFAAVSSHLAAKLVVRQLNGEHVNWDDEYMGVIQQGVDTFRSYVMSWYDGTLEKIFFAKNPDKLIKKQICSVLAGYVWDRSNPYVRNHDSALQRLSKLIDYQNKIKE